VHFPIFLLAFFHGGKFFKILFGILRVSKLHQVFSLRRNLWLFKVLGFLLLSCSAIISLSWPERATKNLAMPCSANFPEILTGANIARFGKGAKYNLR